MLTAADVMTTDVATVSPESSLRDIAQLLRTRKISGVPVVESDGRILGIVSAGDLIGHASIVGERRRSWWLNLFDDEAASARDYIKTHGRLARDVMSANVVTVEETATLADIAELLHRRHIKRVPVVRNGRLAGIVTRSNLLEGLASREMAKAGPVDDEYIRQQLLHDLQNQPWVHLLDVRVQDGVIQLHGTYQAEEERRALQIAAESVPGVERVEDHLTPWNHAASARHAGEG